jgi:hypothetical protein
MRGQSVEILGAYHPPTDNMLGPTPQMLDPTTETKRGNFGSIPPTDTMLGPTPLYYRPGLGTGPWV